MIFYQIFMKFIYCFFQPKYYDGDYKKMLEILIGCKKTGCTFLVGGRNVDGAFKVGLHTCLLRLWVFLFMSILFPLVTLWMPLYYTYAGSWRFWHSRGVKRHVHINTSREVPRGYFFHRTKEKSWNVNFLLLTTSFKLNAEENNYILVNVALIIIYVCT